MNNKEDTKENWNEYFKQQYPRNIKFSIEKDGKTLSQTYFNKYATEEEKQDKQLNALNFERDGEVHEIPESMIDFDFIKRVFKVKESAKFFNIPYQWKNNTEEKKFLKEALEIINYRQTDYRNKEIMWTFEPGFWSDFQYTTKILETQYYYLDVAIIKELNNSKEKEEIDYLKTIVDKNPYYLKYIKTKHKSALQEKTILSYAKDYGLGSLTKEQKNRYEVVKEAFYSHKIHYDKLDSKWKEKEILLDLLNFKHIWNVNLNGKDIITIHELSLDLLENREIIKSCLSHGYNLLELKNYTFSASKWFYDRDFKKLALKTYAHYKIIEDCLDDKEMVLEFLDNLNPEQRNNQSNAYSGIDLFEQTKRIGEEVFKDKEVMQTFLETKNLDNKEYFAKNIVSALQTYSIEDLIDLIKTNKEVYKVLSDELKEKWELILPFYEQSKNDYEGVSNDTTQALRKAGNSYEEKIIEVRKYALNEKLSKNLAEKEQVKRLKI